MEIRRATPADADVLQELWDASSAEIAFTPYPGAAFDESLLARHVGLVAEDGGKVGGVVYANLDADHFGYVYGLYVIPRLRRGGVARELMRAAAAILREAGKDYVLLPVDTPNEPARRLYERLGFEDASRLLRAPAGSLLGG